MTAILDTGSPITIMPRKLRKWLKPSLKDTPSGDRKLVDLNGKKVVIRKVYNLDTSLNGVTREVMWWEVDARTKPIIGMDNFGILGLELQQRSDNADVTGNREVESKENKNGRDQSFGDEQRQMCEKVKQVSESEAIKTHQREVNETDRRKISKVKYLRLLLTCSKKTVK